jgi:post-segregation antitoxin (ccd killing protein)
MHCARINDMGKLPVYHDGMKLMRNDSYDQGARKRTVSLTLNSDLYAKAKEARLNLSKIAEAALAAALTQSLAERARADVKQDLKALEAHIQEHGSFAEIAREHYATVDDTVPV